MPRFAPLTFARRANAAGPARRPYAAVSVLLLALTCAASGLAPFVSSASGPSRHTTRTDKTPEAPAANTEAHARAAEGYGKLPLRFEPNVGQAEAGVDFISRGSGFGLFLKDGEAVLALHRNPDAKPKGGKSQARSSTSKPRTVSLRMKLAGARPSPEAEGVEELPGKVNYLRGQDPAAWRTDVPTFAGVLYRGVYEGVDLVYYGNQRQLEYDFRLAPGADARAIRLSFEGQTGLRIDADGELVLRAGGGEIRQRKPFAYQQEADGRRTEVAARYVLKGRREVGFELGEYDRARPLVIDPVLAYSTYLGGASTDSGEGIEVDAEGNAYVVGNTVSADFPTTPGSLQITRGANDVFVTKLNASGSALVFSTFLGGSTADSGTDLFVHPSGDVFVTGSTNSADFPTTEGAYQRTKSGTYGFDINAFVTRLAPAGNALVYSTFVGPQTNGASAQNIVVDAAGDAYITGYTDSNAFPVTPGAPQAAYGGGKTDAFVTKLKADGSALIYSTYLGGSTADQGKGIALDEAGGAYVTGFTNSPNFPVTENVFQTANRGGNTDDAFVTKVNAAGNAFDYSTYLGGSQLDYGHAVAVVDGYAFVTGYTQSPNFPVSSRAFQPEIGSACAGCVTTDAFVTKFDAAGQRLLYSTFLGGARGNDIANDIKIDAQLNACVVGQSNATDYPVTPDAFRPAPVHDYDAFVTKLNAAGEGLVYSTFIGGAGSNDNGSAVAVDAAGNLYITGTAIRDWPVTPGAFMTTDKFETEAYVSKFDLTQGYTVTAAPSARTVAPGASTTFDLNVKSAGGFAGEVSFAVSGLPAGVTASFSPSTVSGSGATTLTVNAGSSVVEDSYALTVRATSQNGAAAVSYLTLVVAASRPAVRYTVQDLGTLGGAWSRAEDVNASGLVAGASANSLNRTRGFVSWAGGAIRDTRTLAGGFSAYAYAVNDNGDVVGYSTLAAGGERPFIYRSSTAAISNLGELSNADYDGVDHAAYDINNSGHVVGYSTTTNGTNVQRHAFLYRGGVMTDLTPTQESYATGINSMDDVSGYYRTAGGNYQAIFWSDGVGYYLGTLRGPDAGSSYGWDINDSGLVVGESEYSPDHVRTHAFVSDGLVMTDLGTLGGAVSSARAINNAGYIVGYADNANGVSNAGAYVDGPHRRAFVHYKGTMTNLNTLIDAASGWVLVEARGINDAGQIVGHGVVNGATRAFLLTPLAAPAPTPTPTPVATPTPTPTPVATPTPTPIPTPTPAPVPLGGTASPLPGTVQAEGFDEGVEGAAYHDTTAVNLGGKYRTTGVDITTCPAGQCSYMVGWNKAGEWLHYTVNVAEAGTYTLDVRAANTAAGGVFRVEIDGADATGPLNVPNTGDPYAWTNVSKKGLNLAAGQHSFKLVMVAESSQGWVGNFDSFTLSKEAAAGRVNFALASNGGVATASSQYGASFPVAAAINGDRRGLRLADGRYNLWHSAAGAQKPDWLQVEFSGARSIDEVVVVTQQDDYNNAVEPGESTTFSLYGLTAFDVQYWDGSAWQAVAGGSVTGNDRVLRRFNFPAVTTSKVRLRAHASADGFSRVWEFEAWGAAGPASGDGRTNVALASNGATVLASSQYSANFPASAAINGDRHRLYQTDGRYNIWHGAPFAAKPDWLQVNFAGARTITEIGVVTQQDDYVNPVEPTDATTFTKYGLTKFDIQYWDGANWATVAGGSVTGNDRVWRRFTFPAVTTDKIRILIHATADGYSRVMEVEAY